MSPEPSVDWDARLRAAGLRSTGQRRAVLDALSQLRHATVDELAVHVQAAKPDINLSTVYRTLEALDEVGLVTHAHLHHGAPTYHVVDDDPHLHLVCTSCGMVRQQPVAIALGLAEAVRSGDGFEVDLSHLVLHGRCADCAGTPDPGTTPSPRTTPAPRTAGVGRARDGAGHEGPGSDRDPATLPLS